MKFFIDLVFKSFKGINCQIVILHRGTEQMKLTFSGEIRKNEMMKYFNDLEFELF